MARPLNHAALRFLFHEHGNTSTADTFTGKCRPRSLAVAGDISLRRGRNLGAVRLSIHRPHRDGDRDDSRRVSSTRPQQQSILCAVPTPRSAGIRTFFVVAGSCAVAVGWTMAALLFVAGRRLAAYRSWTFCLVVAALSCMFSPFGTILGVFTIFVLCRQSVRELFESTTRTAVPKPDRSRG